MDFGTEKRQAVAGIVKWYEPQELIGKKCAFILNLQKRMLMGIESQCMILAAKDKDGNVAILKPDRNVAAGSIIH